MSASKNPAAEAADPYRKAVEQRPDAGADGSAEKAREREQAALDNVREQFDVPFGAQPHREQPAEPLPEGPNDLGRRNTTPPP